MYKHILIACDGSEISQKSIDQGLDLARMAEARVTAVTVSEPFPTFDLVSKFGLFQDVTIIEKYTNDCKRIADRILLDVKSKATDMGLDCQTVYVSDKAPVDGILDTAKDRACDIIVMTSNGLRGFERFILGSKASEVLVRAPVPVLIVR